jgi:hypothetical protein
MNNLFNALKVSFCRFFIDLTTFEKLSNLKRSKKINLKNLQILKYSKSSTPFTEQLFD